VHDADRLYGIVVVVAAFSVLVQGSLVPATVRLLQLKMHVVEPEPWALGMRMRDEPAGAHQFRVGASSPADGHTIGEISMTDNDIWISLVVRAGSLLPVSADTTLRAGDDVLVLADATRYEELAATFGTESDRAPARVPRRNTGTPKKRRAAGARRTTKESGT
jgi:cell volume regulation protein A